MKAPHTFLAAALLTATILGAACTTSGDSSEADASRSTTSQIDVGEDADIDDHGDTGSVEAPIVEALARTLREQRGDLVDHMTDAQIDCLAPLVVAAYGTDRLEEAELDLDHLDRGPLPFLPIVVDPDLAGELYDLYARCDVDSVALYIERFVGDDGSPEFRGCVSEAVGEDSLRAAVVVILSSEDTEEGPGIDPAEAIARAVMLCGQLHP